MCCQVLIQKEKLHIDCKKSVQISILTNKIAIQRRPNVIKESKQTLHYIYVFFLLLCSHCVADLIKKYGIAFNGSFSVT